MLSLPFSAVEASTLRNLIQEANQSSLELKESLKDFETASAFKKQGRSVFMPEVGVEGGAESHRATSENASNTFGFGYGRWNLFRGGRDYRLLQARQIEEDFQESKVNSIKLKIEREVSKLFYESLYLQNAIEIKEEAIGANTAQKEMAQKKMGGGFTSKADVIEFELREATLKSDLNFIRQENMMTKSQ